MHWMKWTMTGMIMLCSSLGFADLPPSVVGLYRANATTLVYSAAKPEKVKGTVIVEISADESIAVTTITDSTGNVNTYTGLAGFSEPYVYLKCEISPTQIIGGRFLLKGKPGKRSLSGTFHVVSNGFIGSAETKVKLKEVP